MNTQHPVCVLSETSFWQQAVVHTGIWVNVCYYCNVSMFLAFTPFNESFRLKWEEISK